MKGVFFCASAMLLSFSAHTNAEIFDCLKMRDYECLTLEIEIDDQWSKSINDEQMTPLKYAITTKDIGLIYFIVNNGATVGKDDILLMMTTFYDSNFSHQDDLGIIETYEKIPFVAELIRTASFDKDPTNKIINISRIVDLFSSKEAIAKHIAWLVKKNEISKRHLNILLREYKNLFMQDQPCGKSTTINIVKHLLNLNVERWLIKFVLENFRFQQTSTTKKTNVTDDVIIEGSIVDQLSNAIIEESRRLFMRLPPALLVRKAYMKESVKGFDKAAKFSDKLSGFVIATINYPEAKKNKTRNYQTWLSVYRLLLKHGDFFGAFAVGSGLSSSSVEKIVSRKKVEKIAIIDPQGSFKQYRQELAKFRGVFHIPATSVLSKDLTSASEISLVSENGLQKSLHMKGVEYFIKMRESLSQAYNVASKKSFHSSKEITNLIRTQIFAFSTYTASGLMNVSQLIWPTRLSRSFSQRFDAKSENRRTFTFNPLMVDELRQSIKFKKVDLPKEESK